MDFFPLRHGFDLIVKNTFYTVPIEEEEDGRRGDMVRLVVRISRWSLDFFPRCIRLVETVGGVNTSVPNTCVCFLGDLFTEFTMVNHHHH